MSSGSHESSSGGNDAAAAVGGSNLAVFAEPTEQELAEQRKDGYQLNDKLDVRDTVNKWMEARVVGLDPKKGYYINYLGWSEKWNEWIPKNSNRLAPSGNTTTPTSPSINAGAYQLDDDNLVKFRTCASQFTAILAKAKILKEPATKSSFPVPSGVDMIDLTDADWVYIQNEVYSTLLNVINSVTSDLSAIPDAVAFMQEYVLFCTHLLKSDQRDAIRSPLLEGLMKVLNADPIPGDKRFFTKYGATGNETFELCAKGKYAIRPKPTGSGDQLKVVSAYLIQLINLFGEWGGFDAMAKRLSVEGENAPTLMQFLYFSATLHGLEQFYEPKISKKFIPSLHWDVKTILERVKSVSDEEIKNLSRELFRSLVTHMLDLILGNKEIKTKPSEAAEQIQLAVIFRLLNSTKLEKRINGIADLTDLVKYLKATAGSRNGMLTPKQQQDVANLPTCYVTAPKSFLDWSEKSAVVPVILALDSHEEILKRSPTFLKFLASNNALSVEHIFNLFDSVLGSGAGSKHEGFVRIVYDVVADVASELTEASLDQLITRLNSIPKANYTEIYMRFLAKLCETCGRGANIARISPLLQIFWELSSSTDGVVSNDLSHLAISILSDLFAKPQFDSQRIPHIEKAMKALQVEDAPTLKLLHFLMNTLNTFPQQVDPRQWTQDTLIIALDTKLGLTKIFFDELTRYHATAKKVFDQLPIEERANANPLIGNCTHSENLHFRFQFLTFCLEHSNAFSNALTPAHFDIIWCILYSEPCSSADTQILFRLLMDEIDDGSEAGTMNRHRPKSWFSEPMLRHIFDTLIRRMDVTTIVYEGYRCLEMYFCYVNCLSGNLAYPAKKHLSVISFQHLQGIDELWSLVARVTEKRVVITSRMFLVGLYTKVDPKVSKRRHEFYTAFLDRCLEDVHMCQSVIQQGGADVPTQTRMALQYILLLEMFLNACDKLHAPAPDEHAATPGGPEPEPVDLKTSLDRSVNFHRITLSNDKNYFNQLFDLLSLGGEISTLVWRLLTKLPTNQLLEQKITGIAIKSQDQKNINWSELLPTESTIKLLYLLQLIHTYLRRESDHDSALVSAWSEVFLLRGGFQHIYSFVTSLDLDQMFHSSALSQQCLASLIKLLNTFMAFPPGTQPAQLTDKMIDYPKFISILISIIQRAVQPVTKNETTDPANPATGPIVDVAEQQHRSGGLISNTFQLLAYCLQRVGSNSPAFNLIQNFPDWGSVLQLGFDHPISAVREQLQEGLELLCIHGGIDTTNGAPTAVASPMATISPKLAAFFFPKILDLIPRIDSRSTRCVSYFEITERLLNHAPEYHISFNIGALIQHLFEKIQQQPIFESRPSDRDFVLGGYFHLLSVLLHQAPQFKASCHGLVKGLYDALFTLPITANATASQSDAVPPPKCKNHYTRQSAFILLQHLVDESPTNLSQLVGLLRPLHEQTHSGGQHMDEWEFESAADPKSDSGYVGLKNLGSTCYLNSTVQQFFMIPEFRHQLLQAVPNKPEEPNTSVLYQFQMIMAFLQESEKQAYDPQGLCKSFLDFDGNPLNVGVQEDAAGFISRLIDKVMETVKGTANAEALKASIYGQTVDQFIGHPPQCTHYKERVEDFPTIPLTVRDTKTFQDSLKSFVRGEDMTGNNAYKCNACNAKVDTTKRTVFNHLPPTLIFNLKRFEMDFDTMRLFKLNNRFEFPMNINMKPYTKEGIAAAEKAARVAAGTDDGKEETGEIVEHPDWYYEYELTGVTVHMGSMDRGHYYSFIQERPTPEQIAAGETQGRWLEFNDTVVRPFDPRSIPDECYGGTERIQQFNQAGRAVEQVVEKQRNAYLLFYTRKPHLESAAATTTASETDTMQDVDSTATTSVTPSISPKAATPMNVIATSPRHKAPIPPAIFNSVWEQNLTYWRDRFVFDATYFDTLYHIVGGSLGWIMAGAKQAETNANHTTTIHGETVTFSDLDQLFTGVTELATRFVLETLCRARQKNTLSDWSTLLIEAFRTNANSCRWFLDVMTREPRWTLQILLSSPIVQVRHQLALIISSATERLAPEEKAIILQQTTRTSVTSTEPSFLLSYIDSLILVFPVVPDNWKRFNQFFQVLHNFSTLDISHTAYLLCKHDALGRLLDLYLGDLLPNNPFRMPVIESTKKRVMVGDTIVRPDLTGFLGLLSRLVCTSVTAKPGTNPPTRVIENESSLIPLSEVASSLLYSKQFLARLVTDATTRKRGEFVNTILFHHCWENMEFTQQVLSAVVTGIKRDQVDTLRPYFRVIGGLLQINDSIQTQRQDMTLQSLLHVMESQTGFWKPTDFCLEHLIRLSKRHACIGRFFHSSPKFSDWILPWLKSHPTPPRQGEPTLMHKPGRIEPITQMVNFNPYDLAAFGPHGFPSVQHTTQQKAVYFDRLRTNQPIDHDYGSDSDEELNERVFHIGQYVDVLDTVNKWLVGRVVDLSGGAHVSPNVKIHYDSWHPKYDEWIPVDSLRITKFGRFSNKIIVEKVPEVVSGVEGVGSSDMMEDTATNVAKLNIEPEGVPNNKQ